MFCVVVFAFRELLSTFGVFGGRFSLFILILYSVLCGDQGFCGVRHNRYPIYSQ